MNKQELVQWLRGFEAAVSVTFDIDTMTLISEIISTVELELDDTVTWSTTTSDIIDAYVSMRACLVQAGVKVV